MQVCKVYYDNGYFVLLDFGKLSEATQAVITLLEEIPTGMDEKPKKFDTNTISYQLEE